LKENARAVAARAISVSWTQGAVKGFDIIAVYIELRNSMITGPGAAADSHAPNINILLGMIHGFRGSDSMMASRNRAHVVI
jgi:hypothetical protein